MLNYNEKYTFFPLYPLCQNRLNARARDVIVSRSRALCGKRVNTYCTLIFF